MAQTPPPADRLFNNADSFAQVFDETWQRLKAREAAGSEAASSDPISGRLERVLAQVADHPFAEANPELARQVAEFRIRLLGL